MQVSFLLNFEEGVNRTKVSKTIAMYEKILGGKGGGERENSGLSFECNSISRHSSNDKYYPTCRAWLERERGYALAHLKAIEQYLTKLQLARIELRVRRFSLCLYCLHYVIFHRLQRIAALQDFARFFSPLPKVIAIPCNKNATNSKKQRWKIRGWYDM